MTQLETLEKPGVSNTIQASKRDNQYKHWSLTIPRDYKGPIGDKFTLTPEQVILGFKSLNCVSWNFQLEEGVGGYKHYQCSITLKNKQRMTQLKKVFTKAHCEPSRSSASDLYAIKPQTRLEGPWIWPYKYHGEDLPTKEQLRPWQQYLLDVIEKPPNARLVYWVYDEVGGKGKSTFCKFVCYHFPGSLVCGGELKDIAFAITNIKTTERNTFMFDIPRSQKNHVSYAALESIKNGHFFSPKYESKEYMGLPPHVIVFSNFLPDITKLSLDRWVIIRLK